MLEVVATNYEIISPVHSPKLQSQSRVRTRNYLIIVLQIVKLKLCLTKKPPSLLLLASGNSVFPLACPGLERK